LVETGIKTTEGPHPHQGLACFDESGLLFKMQPLSQDTSECHLDFS